MFASKTNVGASKTNVVASKTIVKRNFAHMKSDYVFASSSYRPKIEPSGLKVIASERENVDALMYLMHF